jgi:Domain of unknown function (DUF4333)
MSPRGAHPIEKGLDMHPIDDVTPRTGRRLRRSVLAGGLLATGLAITGCGSATTPLTILNTEKVERAIDQSILAQRGKHADVSCPSGVHQKAGLVFSCTAVVKGEATRFVVTQRDAAGNVHYEAR